jgi:membrane-associated phospholipid phosphatase
LRFNRKRIVKVEILVYPKMLSANFWKTLLSFANFFKKLLAAYWRALLILLIGVCLPLLIFEQFAVLVWRRQEIFPWDSSLLLAIHATANPQLDRFATIFTKLGVYWGVAPVVTLVSLVFLYQRLWRSLTFLLVTTLGSVVINRTAKELLHRVRPNLWQSIAPELDYGFPSGHAMSSMSLVAVLVILSWQTRWRWWVLIGGSAFAITIGWTRLYLGVHFPSDVLAGWLVSIAWAIGVALLLKPTLAKSSTVQDELTIDEEKMTEV